MEKNLEQKISLIDRMYGSVKRNASIYALAGALIGLPYVTACATTGTGSGYTPSSSSSSSSSSDHDHSYFGRDRSSSYGRDRDKSDRGHCEPRGKH